MAAFSPEFLNRLSELGNEYQRLSEKHEHLQQQEQQLQQQKQKLQDEVQQLQEGRALLVTENRSLIEKLQEVTEEKQQLHESLEELKEVKKTISLQLAERDEQITELQQQLHAQHAAHENEILKNNEKREQIQQENSDLQEKLKVLNKKRHDLADQVRLASEEQQHRVEEIASLAAEKQQLLDWKKQQVEESRFLSGRVRTLTLKQKQLQDEKQEVVKDLRKQQEEQQLKWERRVRHLEQLRDEALTQLKNVEEEKTKAIEEHTRESAEKQQWQSKAIALEEQLQQITVEFHRVEDALNTEKNIVEENKQRHQLDMQDYIHRALEQQNKLKQTFAVDYKKACDEIERGNRERHHLIETILEFARAHGCSFYTQQRPDGDDSSNSSSHYRRSTCTTVPTGPSDLQQSRKVSDASSVSLQNAAVSASTSARVPSCANALAAAADGSSRDAELMHIIPAEGSAAAEQQQHWQQQQQQRGTGSMTNSDETASTDAGSASAVTLSTSSISSSSPSTVANTLRLIGARMAALEAAAQAADQQHKRTIEERDALQKAFIDLSEKARAATDAKQQLALRFSAVIYGIRELSEKAAFEQQLVKPLLDPFRASSFADRHRNNAFACPLLSTSNELEAGNISPSSMKDRVTSAPAEKSFANDRVRTSELATSAAQQVDGVTERADTILHENCFKENFLDLRGSGIRGKEERYEELPSHASSEHGYTTKQAPEGHPPRIFPRVATCVAIRNSEENERNENGERLLCNARFCRVDKTSITPAEQVTSSPGNTNAGGQAKATRALDALHFPQDVQYAPYQCDGAAEPEASQNTPSYAVYTPQRGEKRSEEKPFGLAESNKFSSALSITHATDAMRRAVDNRFYVGKHSADEIVNSCNTLTAGTLATVINPSPRDTHYVCGGWDKPNKSNGEGREEEETTDSSSGPSLCDHHFSSNENTFGLLDPCASSPERRVNITDGHG